MSNNKTQTSNSFIYSEQFINLPASWILLLKGFVILSLITSFLLWAATCYSAPSIGNVSGVFIEAATGIEIAGSGFGVQDSSPEFLKDNIAAGAPGNEFSKLNWSQFYTTNKAVYTSDESHSGNNSILFSFTESSSCGLMYDHGSTVNEFYLTAWIKLVKSDTQTRFQWKNWRLKNTNDYHVALDDHSGIIGDCWWGANPGIWGNADVQIYCDGSALQDEKATLESDAFLFDTWQRIEAYYEKSDTGTENGQFEWRRIGRSSGEVIVSNYTAMTHTADCSDQLWRYLLLGHYYGNLSGGEGRDMKIYYDDVYLSSTQARVEIGDALTWENCTHREIQVPTAWSSSSITVTVNQGSFKNGDSAYLFVVDGDGNVSNGYPITIGNAPPSPPSGLKIVD
jgi:hypothetical protein